MASYARAWRLLCAMSPRGEQLASWLSWSGVGVFVASVLFGLGVLVGRGIGVGLWLALAMPSLAIVAFVATAAVLLVGAWRGLAAERAWLATLPFRVERYEGLVGDAPEAFLNGLVYVDFDPALTLAERDAVELHLKDGAMQWFYEPELRAVRYIGHFADDDAGVRRRWLHGSLERLRIIHRQHRFTTARLG